MTNNDLMPGESILSYSDKGLVTLTTHRIRYENKIWGESSIISFMLDKISSLQIVYISYPFLWIIGVVIGAISIVTGMIGRDSGPATIMMAFTAFFLIVAYFTSRRHICSITSDGGTKIIFRTENMATETMIDFMNKIETAQAQRLANPL